MIMLFLLIISFQGTHKGNKQEQATKDMRKNNKNDKQATSQIYKSKECFERNSRIIMETVWKECTVLE